MVIRRHGKRWRVCFRSLIFKLCCYVKAVAVCDITNEGANEEAAPRIVWDAASIDLESLALLTHV